MPNLSRRDFMLRTAQLLALAQIPGCLVDGGATSRGGGRPLVVENHSQALAAWASAGIRDAVLINIDAHDDFRFIPEPKILALQKLYREGDWDGFARADSLADQSLYHIGNWIYAGYRLGLFREIYWVLPHDFFSRDNPEPALRGLLDRHQFPPEDRDRFVLSGNRFRGRVHGMPVTVCGIESLPVERRPVLLSFCIDFFPPYSDAYRESYLQSFHSVFQALAARKYRVQESVVSYSVNGNFLPPYLRWVGDTVASIAKDPTLLDRPPAELLLAWQEIDNAYRSRDANRMLDLTRQALERRPDAGLLLYRACAHHLRNDPGSALADAVRSSRVDRLYSTGLPHLGTLYYGAGKYREAEGFFAAGVAADPEMANGLFQYGHTLAHRGKLRQALEFYRKDEMRNGSFPTRFLIFETYLRLGDRPAARPALGAALAGLEQTLYAEVVNRDAARAIYRALDYCRQEGLVAEEARLGNHPAVRLMFSRYPREKG